MCLADKTKSTGGILSYEFFITLSVFGGERKMDPGNKLESFAASYTDHTFTRNQKNVWEASGF